MIYNPISKYNVDAVVVPMGTAGRIPVAFLRLVFRSTNIHGALVTMPHRSNHCPVAWMRMLTTAKVAGACNAIRLGPGGTLVSDMFDGERVCSRHSAQGRVLVGARVLVVGSGGVGSAIVASLAKAGVMAVYTVRRPCFDNERVGRAFACLLSGIED